MVALVHQVKDHTPDPRPYVGSRAMGWVKCGTPSPEPHTRFRATHWPPVGLDPVCFRPLLFSLHVSSGADHTVTLEPHAGADPVCCIQRSAQVRSQTNPVCQSDPARELTGVEMWYWESGGSINCLTEPQQFTATTLPIPNFWTHGDPFPHIQYTSHFS